MIAGCVFQMTARLGDESEAKMQACTAFAKPGESLDMSTVEKIYRKHRPPPELAEALALGMQAQGCPPAEIRAALTKLCGKSPSPKHLARTLRRWSGQVENEG